MGLRSNAFARWHFAIAGRVSAGAVELRSAAIAEGWHAEILDSIVALIGRRASALMPASR